MAYLSFPFRQAFHGSDAGPDISYARAIHRLINSFEVSLEIWRAMLHETQLDELLQAQQEVRQLRTTVAEMRSALDLLGLEKEQAAQNTQQEAAREAAQLRDTISSMRDQLENLQGEQQRALQQAAADARNELQQHIVTIQTQREEMERMIEAHGAELQQLRQSARDELRLLEKTIAALREQLEAHHGRT